MYIVQPQQLADVWPKVEGWIADALAYSQGDENLLDVLLGIARGAYMLWHAPDQFAAVVQIVNHPRQRVATVLYLGGSDLESIAKALREEGYPWCKQNGISAVRVWGRKGWEKVLGMERKGVILQMELTQPEGRLQ